MCGLRSRQLPTTTATTGIPSKGQQKERQKTTAETAQVIYIPMPSWNNNYEGKRKKKKAVGASTKSTYSVNKISNLLSLLSRLEKMKRYKKRLYYRVQNYHDYHSSNVETCRKIFHNTNTHTSTILQSVILKTTSKNVYHYAHLLP